MTRRLSVLAIALVGAACASTRQPPYVAPVVQTPPAYRESADFKPAESLDEASRGPWWDVLADPELAALEAQVNVSNETLKAVDARFAQARALLGVAQSGLDPQVSVSPTVAAARPSGNRAVSSFHKAYTDLLLPASVSYEADVWGRVHDTVAASRAVAQASAADLESVRLSVQGELAADYVALRGLDLDTTLLAQAVAAYERALALTESRLRGGLAARAEVDQATTQLESTRAQLVDLEAQRATLEHAIAVLVGTSPSTFALAPRSTGMTPPSVPVGIPSELLERRPDIAAAERRVAAANAQLGVAMAARYPVVTLSGTTGFESSALGSLLTGASHFWSLGPTLVQSVFDGGRRRAQVEQARAAQDEAAAAYQATVLAAFREVEDQLVTLRVLEQESVVQDRAVAAAARALTQATNRYRGGVSSYLEVVVAQNASLTNERAAARVLTRRMTGSVTLLKGLGGGWRRDALPALAAAR